MQSDKTAREDADEERQIGDGASSDGASSDTAPEALPESELPVRLASLYVGDNLMMLSGRSLHLVLWIAYHQGPINSLRSDHGQLWLSWKGISKPSIVGKLNVQI